jgi:hypothetical protein
MINGNFGTFTTSAPPEMICVRCTLYILQCLKYKFENFKHQDWWRIVLGTVAQNI